MVTPILGKEVVSMACGCGQGGGKNGAPTKWVFTNAKGETREFRTEMEARAALIRAGGQGSVVGK